VPSQGRKLLSLALHRGISVAPREPAGNGNNRRLVTPTPGFVETVLPEQFVELKAQLVYHHVRAQL
jgi:hypothetical protein